MFGTFSHLLSWLQGFPLGAEVGVPLDYTKSAWWRYALAHDLTPWETAADPAFARGFDVEVFLDECDRAIGIVRAKDAIAALYKSAES